MELTTIREIYKDREKYLDQEIQVGGWVRSLRDSKTFGFIVLIDGSYFETLQVVYHSHSASKYIGLISADVYLFRARRTDGLEISTAAQMGYQPDSGNGVLEFPLHHVP